MPCYSHTDYRINERTKTTSSGAMAHHGVHHSSFYNHGSILVHVIWQECADYCSAESTCKGSRSFHHHRPVFSCNLSIHPVTAISSHSHHGEWIVYNKVWKEQRSGQME